MAKRKVPEDFDEFLDKEGKAIFLDLNPKQQKFLTYFLIDGCSGSKSFRRAYNRKSINDGAASTGAQRVTNSYNVAKIIELNSKKNWNDIIEAKRTLRKGMVAKKAVFSRENELIEFDDTPTQIKAAVEVLKANGEYTERTDNTHSFPKGVNINFIKAKGIADSGK